MIFIFFAHTHRHFDVLYEGKRFINVGSVGMPLHEERKADFGILSINHGTFDYQAYPLPYSYEVLENYYKETDYYKTVGNFAQILLMNLKDNVDYTAEVLNYISDLAKQNNIDIRLGIPDDLWDFGFEEYKKIRDFNRFV